MSLLQKFGKLLVGTACFVSKSVLKTKEKKTEQSIPLPSLLGLSKCNFFENCYASDVTRFPNKKGKNC